MARDERREGEDGDERRARGSRVGVHEGPGDDDERRDQHAAIAALPVAARASVRVHR